jgi:hypothetical protein
MELLLRQTFVSALEGEGFLDTINAGNSWALVKVGDN